MFDVVIDAQVSLFSIVLRLKLGEKVLLRGIESDLKISNVDFLDE